VMPCGVGNLQKGERSISFNSLKNPRPNVLLRYANMDYIFGAAVTYIILSAIQLTVMLTILISYDIACQWFKNIHQRIENHWPEEIKPPPSLNLIPAIPKLHEPMHHDTRGTVDHEVYSLNYVPGVGASDCECPERFWSGHNALGNSTKTQGPGSRHDDLDDHFNFWNWQKYIGMGRTLQRRYKRAVADRNIQVEGHRGLTSSLDQELVAKWELLCVEWEMDSYPKKKTSPYKM
jgi:Kyakuja-Dileera-Zisupton transposase